MAKLASVLPADLVDKGVKEVQTFKEAYPLAWARFFAIKGTGSRGSDIYSDVLFLGYVYSLPEDHPWWIILIWISIILPHFISSMFLFLNSDWFQEQRRIRNCLQLAGIVVLGVFFCILITVIYELELIVSIFHAKYDVGKWSLKLAYGTKKVYDAEQYKMVDKPKYIFGTTKEQYENVRELTMTTFEDLPQLGLHIRIALYNKEVIGLQYAFAITTACISLIVTIYTTVTEAKKRNLGIWTYILHVMGLRYQGCDDYLFAVKRLQKNDTTLTKLVLDNNQITDITALGNALSTNTTLTSLDLGVNQITDITALGNALLTNTTLTRLELGETQITDITALGNALSTNTTLTRLNLGGNQITDITALCNALSTNTTLTTLYLNNNQITAEDKEIITKAWNNRSNKLYL